MRSPFPDLDVEAINELYLPAKVPDSQLAAEKLVRNRESQPIANLANVKSLLRQHPQWAGVVALDRMQGRPMLLLSLPGTGERASKTIFPRPMTDIDVINATEWFQREYFPTIRKEIVGDALSTVAEEEAFDPLQDKLLSLRWDGIPRLDRWLIDYCGADISDAQPEAYVRAVGRCWLLSAVARAMRPGCKADSALVLCGAQGIGKSTAGRILAYRWFSDNMPPLHSKDASDHIRGVWIVEFGEMATASRAGVEELKAFLTRTVERFRPAYGRFEVEYPRRCVFFGTSNRDQFLKDDTGNRRFWPVEVKSVEVQRLESDRDQLWAEAVQAFHDGALWHLNAEEAAIASAQQVYYVMTDERSHTLAAELVGKKKTTTLECISLLGMNNDRRSQMEVAGMLRTLGWIKRSGVTKYWVCPATTCNERSGRSSSMQEDALD